MTFQNDALFAKGSKSTPIQTIFNNVHLYAKQDGGTDFKISK